MAASKAEQVIEALKVLLETVPGAKPNFCSGFENRVIDQRVTGRDWV